MLSLVIQLAHGLAEFLNLAAQGFHVVVRAAFLAAAFFTFSLLAPALFAPRFLAFGLFTAALFAPRFVAFRVFAARPVRAVQLSPEPVGDLIEMFGGLSHPGFAQVSDGLLDVLQLVLDFGTRRPVRFFALPFTMTFPRGACMGFGGLRRFAGLPAEIFGCVLFAGLIEFCGFLQHRLELPLNVLPGLRFRRMVAFAFSVLLLLLAGGIGLRFLGEGGEGEARGEGEDGSEQRCFHGVVCGCRGNAEPRRERCPVTIRGRQLPLLPRLARKASSPAMHRRRFLHTSLAATLTVSVAAREKRAPRILLRSSWQVVNIGDIAHTPGVLALLEKHWPEAEVTLWASGDLSEEVMAMEHRRFPKLTIVKGSLGADGKASNAALGESIARTDFLLHGSGPSLVAAKDVAAFVKHTGKPFGVFGITYAGGEKDLLSQAKFVFFRDSVSLEKAKSEGVTCPVLEFGPDGAFACDLQNEEAAAAFLRTNGLEDGKFLCCIPRLRFTPYWKIGKRVFDEKRHARNEEMKEHDHAPLRAAITAVVKEGMKVLICPEDMSQMEVGKEMLLDKLPDDIRRGVVWREKFWLTDEALFVYRRSAGLFGLEMHSPIMCIGAGVPAIVCRFSEQTSKGLMWRDIGLGDWLFDFDREEDLPRLPPAVLSLVRDPAAAKAKAAKAREFVQQRQKEMVAALRRLGPRPVPAAPPVEPR